MTRWLFMSPMMSLLFKTLCTPFNSSWSHEQINIGGDRGDGFSVKYCEADHHAVMRSNVVWLVTFVDKSDLTQHIDLRSRSKLAPFWPEYMWSIKKTESFRLDVDAIGYQFILQIAFQSGHGVGAASSPLYRSSNEWAYAFGRNWRFLCQN